MKRRRGRGPVSKLNRQMEHARERRATDKALSWMGRKWRVVYDRESGTGDLPPNLSGKKNAP